MGHATVWVSVELSAVWRRGRSRLALTGPLKTLKGKARGRVAKLADARDLKSRVPIGACGFESRLGYLWVRRRVAMIRRPLQNKGIRKTGLRLLAT